MSDQIPAEAPARKPAKRSVFAKPTWTRSNSGTGGKASQDPTEFFSRSSHSFKDIIAEQEARNKARREAESNPPPKARAEDRHESKRRRLSPEDKDDFLYSVPDDETRNARQPQVEGKPSTPEVSIPTPAQNSVDLESMPAEKKLVIQIDSDDDDVVLSQPKPTPAVVAIPNEDDNDENEDAETRALVEAARERRRQREQRDLSISPLKPRVSEFDTSQSIPTPPIDDPVVQILIDSPIPNTTPLIVRRKLSQNLKEVRFVYCKRQGFSDDMIASVCLAYVNRRLYDVTTLKSLKVERDFFDDDIKVHLEAVTPEILSSRKKQAEELARIGAQDANEDDFDGAHPENDEAEIKITLKAKGFIDFGLTVKPTTTFEKIANAYRAQHQISPTVQLHLVFDGDRLDPSEMMQDSEVADMDAIEVHMK